MDVVDLLNLVRTSESAQDKSVRISSTDLEKFWSAIVDDSYSGRLGLRVAIQIVAEHGGLQEDSPNFEYRVGGWEINVSRAIVQTLLSTALLGGVLASLGADDLPVAVVTAVVPMVFDVNRVTLTKKDNKIYAHLVAKRSFVGKMKSAQELYSSLPEDVRDQFSELEFVDFLETCYKAGLADKGLDEEFQLRDTEMKKFRITLS